MNEALKHETLMNPILTAVCHLWATRQRARGSVMINALHRKMKSEGFRYTKTDYANVLGILAKHGVGKLDVDSKGKVLGLIDIKITLQSLALVCLGSAPQADTFKVKNRYIQATPVETPQFVERRANPQPGAVLFVPLTSGKLYKTYIPHNLTEEDSKRIGDALAALAA